MIVTIDGPAGAGKSTVARSLARRLDVPYLDTGAMFRALTLLALREGVALDDEQALLAALGRHELEMRRDGDVLLNGASVRDALRAPEVTRNIRAIAASAPMRAYLLAQQRDLAKRWGSLVCDGRDTGTVVFPRAELKIYLDASSHERATRRHRELSEKGLPCPPLAELEAEILARDESDRRRAVAPLAKADDALTIDSTELSAGGVLERLFTLAKAQRSKARSEPAER